MILLNHWSWLGQVILSVHLEELSVFTGTVTGAIAEWFSKRFVEIIIAPEFTSEALEVFGKKKNLRLLETPIKNEITGEKLIRSVSGGILVQDEDEGVDTEFKNVTKLEFDANKMELAKFGITACKHLKVML